MIGLILKDLLNLKKQAKVYLILLVFYFVLGISNEDFTIAGSMIALVAVMLPITAMSYDERSKWDRYALTMPVTRMNIVASKYILGLVFLVIAFVIATLFSLFFTNISLIQNVLTNLTTLSIGIIIMSVIFPILFKFGVEKGRIFMMLILFAPTGIIALLARLGFNFSIVDEAIIKMLLNLSPVIAIIIFIISILISLNIYKKIEF